MSLTCRIHVFIYMIIDLICVFLGHSHSEISKYMSLCFIHKLHTP